MAAFIAPGGTGAPGRRCRTRQRDRGALRPGDLLTAHIAVGVAFLVAAGGVALADVLATFPSGRWLALHLAFVGGISQLVLGASLFFAGAFLATDPPPRALVRAHLGAWNAGTLAVAAGFVWGAGAAMDLGGALLVAGLVLFEVELVTLRRRSLQTAPWAVRWYAACASLLGVGVLAGVAMARGAAWAHGDLLSAHIALNVAGWLGTAIVGTLHTFYPSLTRTRLRFPGLQPVAFWGWVPGVAALAAGYAFAAGPLVVAGWLGLAVAAVALALNVAASTVEGGSLALPARLVAVGQASLVAGLALALLAAVSDPLGSLSGAQRGGLAALLLAGWVGLTVLGSLLHLAALLRRVRSGFAGPREPRGRPDRWAPLERWAPPAAAAGVTALAAGALAGSAPARLAGAVLLAGVAVVLGARIVVLATGALRAGPLRI